METAGADPESGVDVPESSSTTQKRAAKVSHPDTEPVVKDAVDSKLSDAVDSLLQHIDLDTDWRPIKLPSRGKAYVDCEESIFIKPFTFNEERKLRSIKRAAQGTSVINSLVKDCVKGLEYDAMTLEDKNYILFKLREISYGDEYTIQGACEGCESKNSLVIEISKVPVKYADDEYEEPLHVTLPDSKQEVRFITPRCKDEEYFSDMENLTDNLWRFVLSIGEYSDKKVIKSFFEKTTVRDLAKFRNSLVEDRYGMNKTMSFECANCGELTESLIPFTESFFSVS